MVQNPIRGKAHVFGDNIDTDQILAGCYLELTDPLQIASHCMESIDPDFAGRFQNGDIVVAGTNFGCGSSREHAVIALKYLGAGAVVAKSFARIFFRNAINLGLPVLVCRDIDRIAAQGRELSIDTGNWTLGAYGCPQSVSVEPVSDYALKILNAGGIKPLMKTAQD